MIVLSDEFFQEVMAHPIPTDLEAVKLLVLRARNSGLVRLAIVSVLHGASKGVDTALRRLRFDPSAWSRGIRTAAKVSQT